MRRIGLSWPSVSFTARRKWGEALQPSVSGTAGGEPGQHAGEDCLAAQVIEDPDDDGHQGGCPQRIARRVVDGASQPAVSLGSGSFGGRSVAARHAAIWCHDDAAGGTRLGRPPVSRARIAADRAATWCRPAASCWSRGTAMDCMGSMSLSYQAFRLF
jgi:hypothetical protein